MRTYIAILVLAALLIGMYLPVTLYYKFGMCKKLFHFIWKVHIPGNVVEDRDGNKTSACKICGKPIIEDKHFANRWLEVGGDKDE